MGIDPHSYDPLDNNLDQAPFRYERPAPIQTGSLRFSRRAALWIRLAPFFGLLVGCLCAVLAVRSFVLYFAMDAADLHLWLSVLLAVAAFGLLRCALTEPDSTNR